MTDDGGDDAHRQVLQERDGEAADSVLELEARVGDLQLERLAPIIWKRPLRMGDGVYVYIYIYIYIYGHINTYIHTFIDAYIDAYIYRHRISIYTYKDIWAYAY